MFIRLLFERRQIS